MYKYQIDVFIKECSTSNTVEILEETKKIIYFPL